MLNRGARIFLIEKLSANSYIAALSSSPPGNNPINHPTNFVGILTNISIISPISAMKIPLTPPSIPPRIPPSSNPFMNPWNP